MLVIVGKSTCNILQEMICKRVNFQKMLPLVVSVNGVVVRESQGFFFLSDRGQPGTVYLAY